MISYNNIAVTYTDVVLKSKAVELAKRLKLPLVERQNTKFDSLLVFSSINLSLITKNHKTPFVVDFLSKEIQYRINHPPKELLLKACGIKKIKKPTILDITAGWGRDGFILANSGCNVTMLEKSDIVYTLLEDGLNRLRANRDLDIKCINTDALDYLNKLNIDEYPNVIYIDPMRDIEGKSAKNKKEMEILRNIVGIEKNIDTLINAALKCAKNRVVIKFDRLYENPYKNKCDISFDGSNSRFDVYLL